MARRILNRRELREESDAAERLEDHDDVEELDEEEEVDEADEEEEVVKTVKKPVRRKSRAKAAKEVRLKAFWGVFSQSMTQVATFEYSQAQAGRHQGQRTDRVEEVAALRATGQEGHRRVG